MEIMKEKSKYALHEHMHLITTPLQVIWGKQDQVGVPMKWLCNVRNSTFVLSE